VPFQWYVPLLVLAVFASSVAMLEGWGIFVFALVAILAFLLNHMPILKAVACFLGLLFAIALLSPAISCAREASKRMACNNNLKQISLALHNYKEANGCLPPAHTNDKNGRPMHSWRVLILPYFEGDTLHKQYDMNEPWDGPNNKKLLDSMPYGYFCPCDRAVWANNPVCTDYVAVVGRDAAWAGAKPGSPHGSLAAALFSTITLVEASDARIPWTEPRDLDLDALAKRSPGCVTVSSKHDPDNEFFYHSPRPGSNVALADGSVRFLPGEMLAPERLPGLLKIGGFHEDQCEASSAIGGRDIHWPHCIALAAFIVSSSWLLVCAVRGRQRRSAAVSWLPA
jgi:hypothetical protein